MAHLLVVIDEFAEMKKEHPELITELVSLFRIGRSLGLHLILSTQRPAGVIDEEIRSNSRFRIALRMNDEGDSREVLGRSDAAHLKEPGEFCFLADRSFLSAKSVYAKSDPLHEPYRVSVLRYDLAEEKTKSFHRPGETPEIVDYIGKIMRLSRELGLRKEPIDLLPPSPEELDRVCEKGTLVLGRKDDFLRRDQSLLSYPEKEDLLIVSKRKEELNVLIAQYERNGIPLLLIAKERHKGSAIRDSILYDEEEDIAFLFHQLLDTGEEGMILLIEDLSLFCALKEEYTGELLKLLRLKGKNGLSFCFLSSSTRFPYRILNAFEHRILIDDGREEDLQDLFGKKPLMKGKSFYEEDGVRSFVPVMIPERKEEGEASPYLRKIPSSFPIGEKGDSVMIGYDLREREEIFVKKEDLLICSFSEEALSLYEKAGIAVKKISLTDTAVSSSSILFVGKGLSRQRLFYPADPKELRPGEGYLCNGDYEGRICVADRE